MTLYAPTDVRAVTVPIDRGGCGEPHEAPADLAEGDHMALDCLACEAHVNTLNHGWAPDPLNVSLTPDERRRQEALGDRARAAQASTWADPAAIGNAVAAALSAHSAPKASVLDALRAEAASLDAEGRAALAELLGLSTPTAPPTPSPEPTPAPVKAAADDPAPVAKKTAAKKATPPAAGS